VKEGMKKNASSVSTPFWRDKRIIPILLQAIFAVIVVAAAFYLLSNAIRGMEKIGIKLGFSFLQSTASFDIGQSLIEYKPSDSYGRAVLVGILNTLKVSFIGIILATIIGIIVGVARLSTNWLVRKVAGIYVEVIRNTPVLVQIFIWYFAVFVNLPKVKESIQLPGNIYISNRGAAIPWFDVTSGTAIWAMLLLIGIILAVFLWNSRLKSQVETGKRKYPLVWSIGPVVVALAAALAITQQAPAAMTYPSIGKFNYEGGNVITPEFAAILIGLVVYTAAYIAEIVRAGIMAVSKGQVEAAKSLGLKSSTTMRLIIFPQAIRIIIPPLTSQYLNLAKNSSLAIAVGYPDLFSVGGTIANQTGRAIEMIAIMLLVYLSLSLLTSLFMNIFNKSTQLVER
jgi:general L-amino acid transport system permease protein